MDKVYAIQYVLFKVVEGKQELIDVRITGIYSKFDGEKSAVEALERIASPYDIYVPCGGSKVAIYGDSACFNVSFDADGNVLDSYYDKNTFEKMKVRKLWYTVSMDLE